MPTINLEYDDRKELRVVGASVRSDMEAIILYTNRHPTLEEANRARTILAAERPQVSRDMSDVRKALEAAGQELAVVHGDNVEFGIMARAAVLAFLKAMPECHFMPEPGYDAFEIWTPKALAAAMEKETQP